ncbi:hypothetical protein L2E82_10155 [Cichorium intybus]|uniref:Uncharacterized protein n=1 Tax=Cichorium intybus TaxID=13427 RepID=A0ACB9G9S2_CICIN|nr:hypothetical protein L2E82_10155 [Cichorium intybus]
MSGVTDDVAAFEVLSYGRKRVVIMEAVDHDPNCVLANILAAHFSCSSDPSRVPSLLHAANSNIEYATPYEKVVFEAINCLISPNRNDDVAFELHSKRSVPNGKLMRRAGASSSSTSNSTSVKRGSERRTSTMYVLREGRKNTNVKEKSTYVKRADRQSSEKCLSSSTVMTVERKKRKRSKKLSEQLQQKGFDIIQTEGGKCSNPSKPGVLGV